MGKTVVIATNNAHKVAGDNDRPWISRGLGVQKRCARWESNPTLRKTRARSRGTRIKALAAHNACGGCAALADDSASKSTLPTARPAYFLALCGRGRGRRCQQRQASSRAGRRF